MIVFPCMCALVLHIIIVPFGHDHPDFDYEVVCSRQAMKPRICVCVRKRPLTYTESRRGEVDVVSTLDGECVIVHEGKEAVDLTQYILQVYIILSEETVTKHLKLSHPVYPVKVTSKDTSNCTYYQTVILLKYYL